MRLFLSASLLVLAQLVFVTPAVADGVCDSDDFQKACKKAQSYYQQHCSNPRSLDAYRPESDANTAWMEEVKVIDEIVAFWTEVAKKYPDCYSGHGGCRLSKYERDKCLGMPAQYKESFADFAKTIEGSVVDGWKRDIERLKKNPMDPFASKVFATAKGILAKMAEVASLPVLGADTKEIEKLQAWIDEEEAGWQHTRAKALAKVKCPKPTYRNKHLTKLLRNVMDAHSAAIKKPESTLVETVGQFGLAGKPRQEREAFKHEVHEDIPAFACVLQERDEQRTCRIFDLTFRRIKPDGGKWGDWAVYSTGGGGEMSCKNLKGIK